MELELSSRVTEAGKTASTWQSCYRVGGAAALIIVLVGLLDILLSFVPGTGTTPGALTTIDWFRMYQGNALLGLRNLGLANMLTTALGVPVFFALYAAHRRVNPAPAALAVILMCMGATIYIANNTALPMLTLSGQYAAATTEPQRALIAAAGQAVLAREDLTAGAFMGFFFAEIAGIVMALVMLRSKIFSRLSAWMGVLGECLLLIFNICAAFVPAIYDVAMILAMVGGILSMIWFILTARRLFRLAQDSATES